MFSLGKVLNQILKLCGRRPSERHLKLAETARENLQRLAGGLLGILEEDPEAFVEGAREKALAAKGLSRGEIEEMIARREEARKKKDFATADALRDELGQKGILLRDTPWGTFWKVEDL